MFNLTNYKAAPYSALSFWATKTARSRFHHDTRDWTEESYIVANTESIELEVVRAVSILLDFALTNTKTATEPLSFVQLHKYDRGDVSVEVGEWTAFKQKGESNWHLGLVIDLIVLRFGNVEEFYMRCGRLVNLNNIDFDTDYSCVKLPVSSTSDEVSLQVDSHLAMCDVHADLQGDHVVLTYYG